MYDETGSGFQIMLIILPSSALAIGFYVEMRLAAALPVMEAS
jgi:hypothetical protein